MPDRPDALMIFAAGFGTRMGALTRDRPKPLVPVAGRALLDHALDLARDARIARVAVNAHYRAGMIRDHVRDRDVRVIEETPTILDTGGGLRNALGILGHAPLFTLNSDAIWAGPNPLRLLAEAWQPDDMDALLICVPRDRAVSHAGKGSFIAARDGSVTRGPGLVYCGAQILRTDRLAEIAEQAFSLNRLWDLLLADNRLRLLEYPGTWCDVGSPRGIADAEAMLAAQDV